MTEPDKAHFMDRVSREMDEDLGTLERSPRACRSAPWRRADSRK